MKTWLILFKIWLKIQSLGISKKNSLNLQKRSLLASLNMIVIIYLRGIRSTCSPVPCVTMGWSAWNECLFPGNSLYIQLYSIWRSNWTGRRGGAYYCLLTWHFFIHKLFRRYHLQCDIFKHILDNWDIFQLSRTFNILSNQVSYILIA